MTTIISKLTPEFQTAVREFNRRIAAGGCSEFRLPEEPDAEVDPHSPDRWESWLAIQNGIVRVGYRLKHQAFLFSGQQRSVAFYNLSLSEAVVDKRFATVGIVMATTAMKQNPLIFALGMGGRDRPLPKLLSLLGWQLHDVPFRFKALRPSKVFRNLRSVRKTTLRRAAMDLFALTGVATVGLLLWQNSKTKKRADAGSEVT